jgi:FdhD protein
VCDTEPTPTWAADAIASRRVLKATAQGVEDTLDAVAVERWLRITVNGREVAAVMCSPGYETELAAGFALTQGLIRERGDLLSVALRTEEQGDAVRIVVPVELSLTMAGKLTARGSCGGAVYSDDDLSAVTGTGPAVSVEALHQMARAMSGDQDLYKRTGGTHAAGVFMATGEHIVVREDVGRHNAVDKAVGHCLLSGHSLADKIMVTTGRASREIAAKAVRAGVPVLASVSAATDAGIEVAERGALTLVAFLRGRRLNVCAHPERIDLGEGA